MRHNLIQLEDNQRRTFHIEIWTPSAGTKLRHPFSTRPAREGSWKAIDKGFLRHYGGAAWRYLDDAIFKKTADLYLGPAFGTIEQGTGGDDFRWGLVLHKYDDGWGTNESGWGEVIQRWVLAFEPGMIRWRKPGLGEIVASNVANATAGRKLSN